METRKLLTRLIVLIVLISTGVPVLLGFSVPKASEVTKIVSYPLPSVPEFVLLGGEIRVEVKVSSGASGWTAGLSSRFGSSDIDLINSSYSTDRWTLFFNAPEDIPPELYDLEISYQDGGETVEYTQSRCVKLLEEWPEEIVISHISDVHLQHGRNFFAQYIHEMNLLDPDLIIVSGDVVQTETVAVGWDYLQSQMKLIDVPTLLLPGNHDHAGGSGRIYQRYGGPWTYSTVIGDFLFIAMDSHLEGEDWSNQFQFVESELQRHPDKVKIMSWHHPLLGYEIEDVDGTPVGHNITGTWEELEPFKKISYDGWMWGPDLLSDAFTELLRVIQVYDVRVILNGHVHYDVIHLLNNRHYFINVGPIGGGLPPGQHHGYRLVTVDSESNVELDRYAAEDVLSFANSIPIYGLRYWYSSENDWSESSVSATVVNDLEMPIDDARLEFRVSEARPVEGYSFSVEPDSYEVYTVDEGYIFVSYFDVGAGGRLDVTLSSEGDSQPPEISLEVSEFSEGGAVIGTVTVTDEGWGVSDISLYYSNDVISTWDPLELTFSPTVNGDVYDITYPDAVRGFTIPAEVATPGIALRVEAVDYAGNQAEFTLDDLSALPRYTLSVDTDPSGISITVDGSAEESPFSGELEAGDYEVSVPEEVVVSGSDYTFSGWDDRSSEASRSVSLEGDVSIVANYEEAAADKPAGIPLPTPYVLVGLLMGVSLIYLLRRR